jgi:beta-glucosidase
VNWRHALIALAVLASGIAAVPAQDPATRARKLVSRMTLDEKLDQLHGIRDSTHYRFVPPLPRLGIPALQITNGPSGAGPGGTRPQAQATALPAPISLAATWDLDLARLNGATIGTESRDLGNALVEAPTINIARVPQNGRTFEGYGEDPYLVSQISINNIVGMQNQGVIANVKHFAANNQETNRMTVNEEIDERALREIYLPAFEASVKEAHVGSLMCAYPRVNGTYCCENDFLLNQLLKKEWGFSGFVTSDFGAVHSDVPSATAGLDLEMPTGKYFGDDELKAALQSGQLPMSVIDDKLIRRFSTMIRFGVFDHPPVPQPIPAKEDGAIARRLAEEGMVLLKNDAALLPLDPAHLKSFAVIGPAAVKAVTGGGGSSHVAPLYTVDPVDGIRARAGSKVQVEYSDGGDLSQAAALARASDVTVVMVGDIDTEGRDHPISLSANQDSLVAAVAAANPRTIVVVKSGSAVLMPWVDRVQAVLEAWYPGEEDGNAVAAVLFGDFNPAGKLPITFPKNLEDVPANTAEQYPGILPAGAPSEGHEVQIAKKDVPAPAGVAHYTEGVFVGYRHYDAKGIAPLFPFGHGLSYTTFSYERLKITRNKIFLADPNKTFSVELDLTNTGSRSGAEVVQLYVGMPSTTEAPEPPKELKGFKKLALDPKKQIHVRLPLDRQALSHWDMKTHRWVISPGTYQIMVGASSRDIRLQGQLQVVEGKP